MNRGDLEKEVNYLMFQNKIKTYPISDLSDEMLKEIIQDYNNIKFKKINETILGGVINIVGKVVIHADLLEEETVNTLSDEFLGNEEIVSCSSSVVGLVSSKIPMIGLVTGGIIVAKFLYDGIFKAKEKTEIFEDAMET